MYTQCPECKQKHPLTIDQLRSSLGVLVCDNCSVQFYALELIQGGLVRNSKKRSKRKKLGKNKNNNKIFQQESIKQEQKIKQEEIADQESSSKGFNSPQLDIKKTSVANELSQPLSTFLIKKNIELEEETVESKELTPEEIEFLDFLEKPPKQHSPFWLPGFFLCLVFLIFQVVFFEANSLAQNTTLRPWLDKFCIQLNCNLPAYKNLAELTVLHGSFELTDKAYYIFKTTFINYSAFAQQYPSIKLTIIDYSGQILAERVFKPNEYSKLATRLIEADMSAEVSMKIAIPSYKMGGYHFELI